MRYFLLFFLLFTCFATLGQQKYSPSIVVLDPYQTQYDPVIFEEIKGFTYRAVYTPQEEKYILDSLSKSEENIRIMNVAEFHYRKQMNFASSFTLSLYGMLTYMVFGQTENCLIIPSHDSSVGTIEKLKAVAEKHNVQWVVNPLKLRTYKKDGKSFTTARVQVYDIKKNKIVLDKEYTGDTKNPGFELTCESGTLNCTISNILTPSLQDILLTISGNY